MNHASTPATSTDNGQGTAASADNDNRLKITEIFHSLQGESTTVGLPTVFVRLTGCPLRCVWCDTAYAFSGGEWRDIDAIVDEVRSYNCQQVTVTGGEPLAQKRCLRLLQRLCDAGLSVAIETSGAIDIEPVDERVSRVMDLKAPDSGEESRNLYSNIEHLAATDQLKFVLASRRDYDWAVSMLAQHELPDSKPGMPILFSPVHATLEPGTLAEWILADRLPVRMQLQMHKLIWGDKPGV